jgi:hypothetical protein
MIHESYGNDLDMTTDDEDNYHKQSIHSTPDKSSPKQLNKNKTDQIYDVRLFFLIHSLSKLTNVSSKITTSAQF